MSNLRECPNCTYENKAEQLICENCGIDIAIAAAYQESRFTKVTIDTGELPVAPEILVPRLGGYIVEKGLIDLNQLETALQYQQVQAREGVPLLIGQALVSLEMIDQKTLDQAVTEQIVFLQEALKQSNQHLEERVAERTEELQRAVDKLTDINQLKNNFVSNISHELRTPLAHMLGYLDLLIDKSLGPLTKEQDTALDVLMRSYNRLSSKIDNLIQFSLASETEMVIDRKSINLSDMLSNAVAQATPRANTGEVSVTLISASKNLSVIGDEEKINWVIDQLVDNAVKFNEPGGKVEIEAQPKNGVVIVKVIDDGIGIEDNKIAELFEPFHQLDGSTTRKYGGTGLGLALVKQILDAHQSNLKVTSKIGEGSHFEFSLPAS